MYSHSSKLQTLLGSFHADIWEVDDILPYVASLSDIDRLKLKEEMEGFLRADIVDSRFMRRFISDDFVSDKKAKSFFQKVMLASFEGEGIPDIDDYIA